MSRRNTREANRSREQFESFAPLGPAVPGAFLAPDFHGTCVEQLAAMNMPINTRDIDAAERCLTARGHRMSCMLLMAAGVLVGGTGCGSGDELEPMPAPRVSSDATPGPAPPDALLDALAPARGNVVKALEILRDEAGRRRGSLPERLDSDQPLVRIVEGKSGTIRELFVQGIYLTDKGLPQLASVHGLQRLHLYKVPITDDGLAALTAFQDLTGLSLGRLNVTDAGMAHLAKFPRLRRLAVEGPRISQEGVRQISALEQLEGLGLSGLGITDEALEPIRRLKRLKLLSLSGTAVSDAGLAHLSACEQLVVLSLADTRVSDMGLDALKSLSALRMLRLDGTRVTSEGVQPLRQALPQCKIATRTVQ
mgnify:CR=1 FL=1